MPHLQKFLDAQNQLYLTALKEIRSGKKESHWMWFIFPQIDGLGKSETARFYAIKNLEEAQKYYAHPILGDHLVQVSSELLSLDGLSAADIFGYPDDLKLRSSMTLFANVPNSSNVFQQVLDRYFDGMADIKTLELLRVV
ncbi:MAG: DUF1810 domain-containing protein [Flavobacterium sp.]|uniref:DUF1810 domain-containing protein n=1 Tax=Flavobacterium sp. TaxID=239 RepID=UPI0012253363|nr:DUF1810 domain-containing protein [Flavobacterium sp.]RZJ66291.1 MAG: DUF1810 domain-containing protein [Flavobacterium sp.]